MASLQDSFARDTELCMDGQITCKSSFPTKAGGYSDVYEGHWGDRSVAIKVVRPFDLQWKKLLRRLWREYVTWSRLTHPNILPCLGYSYDFSPGTSYSLPSLISPWMENGTITSYLEKHPDADRIKLLVGVASGLSYLHTRDPVIVHGDLRGGNILVSDQGVACLADFGLSRVLQEIKGMTTTSELAGSVRWMSPELFKNNASVSVYSDTWAYGMTVLEILTGERPYSALKNDIIVLGEVRDGKIPSRSHVVDSRMWDICVACWSFEPKSRPAMEDVVSMTQTVGACKDSERTIMARILSNLQDHDAAWAFFRPVNSTEVTNPMSFDTMEHKLNHGLYPDLDSFVSDANLVFDNCMLYHNNRGIYGRDATELKKFFNKLVDGVKNPQYTLMIHILSQLQQHSDAGPFLQPIDPEVVAYDYKDYYNVTMNPIDFGTMEHKLHYNLYPDLDSFISDANLVFSNRMEYHNKDNDYFRSAVKLKKFLEELMADSSRDLRISN